MRTAIFGIVAVIAAGSACSVANMRPAAPTPAPVEADAADGTDATSATDVSRPFPPVSTAFPPAIGSSERCYTTLPIAVTTVGSDEVRADLCADATQSLAVLPSLTDLAAGGFAVELRASGFLSSPKISCRVDFKLSSNAEYVDTVTATAAVDGHDADDALDCLEAVVDDVVAQRIGPMMRQRLARPSGSGTTPAPVF